MLEDKDVIVDKIVDEMNKRSGPMPKEVVDAARKLARFSRDIGGDFFTVVSADGEGKPRTHIITVECGAESDDDTIYQGNNVH